MAFDLQRYWQATAEQDAAAMAAFFQAEACVFWHNTNEQFTAGEFIRANCVYPGRWIVQIEREERLGDLLIAAARVRAADGSASFHAVSFFQLHQEKIIRLDEYWGDDGPPPAWRSQLGVGRPIGS